MNEQANKILAELLQKAASGIDAAVSFSQAQIPDVIHQLLLWNFFQSLIITVIALASIPPVIWFVRKQCHRVQNGVIGKEGYSWEEGKPKYTATLVWDSKGEINIMLMFFLLLLASWGMWIFVTLANPTWLKIWLAPKLYLIEYAASLVK